MSDKIANGLSPIQRWKHEFQKASGSREMVEDGDGEWIQYEDMQCAMAFVTGYLGGHCEMLEQCGMHPTIVKTVRHIIAEIEKL